MNATVIIPSLNPDEKIISTVKSLIDEGFDDIVLVDDGSDEEHKARFEEAKALGNVTLLVHEVNKGKGRAMKTAFEYILENRPNKPNVITVDGDGQHLATDVKNVSKSSRKTLTRLFSACVISAEKTFPQDQNSEMSAPKWFSDFFAE